MKKIILSFVLVLGSLSFISAQDNAIGLKFGYGVDLSYQRMLNDSKRIELDLGLSGFDFDNPALFVTGVYHWVFDLSQLAPGFKWYVGPGAGLGISDSSFALKAVGQIGIEYNFNFPLQLSLDWTPGLLVVPDVDFHYQGFALGIRYRF